MIQLSHNYTLPEKKGDEVPIKVVGVGGAGLNVLDRIVLDGMTKANIVAINTDLQSLASSVAAHKVQLGEAITRGLGAGGDPEVGYEAAEESVDAIQQALADSRILFVCTGLGGGTGSGAAPAVVQIARETGSAVLVFATLPFAFEGKRRMAQARDALTKLQENADAVICFENDRMGDMVAPKAGIHQAFAVADATISQSVRSIANLIQRPGLIQIGLGDLLAALRSSSGRCLFGFGESDSDNRAHDALNRALKNPLMDRGRQLGNASHVLVHIAGGPAMTLSEVEILMKELGRHISDQTQILFGTSVDGRMGNRLSVTLISSLWLEEEVVVPPPPSKPARRPKPEPISKQSSPKPAAPLIPEPVNDSVAAIEEPDSQIEELPVSIDAAPLPPERLPVFEVELPKKEEPALEPEVEPAPIASVPQEPLPEQIPVRPRVILPKKKPLPIKEAKPAEEKKVHAKQEVLQFEPVTRGRFEKSEPTIVEGQDLDIPTFLRKNVRVK